MPFRNGGKSEKKCYLHFLLQMSSTTSLRTVLELWKQPVYDITQEIIIMNNVSVLILLDQYSTVKLNYKDKKLLCLLQQQIYFCISIHPNNYKNYLKNLPQVQTLCTPHEFSCRLNLLHSKPDYFLLLSYQCSAIKL